jgi:hypothetical protein
MTAIWLLVFLFGAAAGSFLNVCAWRIPQKEPFILGRSLCPQCKHPLGARDLIPLFSFIRLRGRCRYCHGRISLRYPLVELVSGFLCVAVVWVHGFSFLAVVNLVLVGILLTAALIDLEWLYVPNRLVLFGLICGTILSFRFGVPLGAPSVWGLYGDCSNACHIPGKPGWYGSRRCKTERNDWRFLGVEAYCFSTFSELFEWGSCRTGTRYYWEKRKKRCYPLCSLSCFWGRGGLTLGRQILLTGI